ncbi:MAG: hypothetical protein COA49_00660 [Bacteroidetes bacterium]|nr:MAG: hypothetical protein COA49_00660 [Bacteroidota bacterium]
MKSSLSRTSTEILRNAEVVEEVHLRILRASQDVALCHQMVEGHKRVLRSYGIKKISSFNTDWIGRDDVILIAAISADGEKILAGSRLQSGPSPMGYPLFQAVGNKDDLIEPWINSIIPEGAMELNGMWNSIELAGMGLGFEWLVQSAMASMSMLDIRHLLALTSPVTRRMRDKMGWKIRGEFGEEGFFKYPTEKLRASIEQFIFPEYLQNAQPEVNVFLEELWAAPIGHEMSVEGPKGKLKVRFNFSI